MADLVIPQAVRDHDQVQKSRGAEGEPEGFVYRGKVYIVAGELATPTDVIRVLFHESLGHVGLRGVFGDKLKPILDQLAALRRGDIIKKARQYGLVRADANGNPVVDVETATDKEVFAAMDQGHKREAAEEVLAVMAQTKPEMGYVKRAIALIRGWLRANVPGFGAMKMTDADIIANFILPARRFIEGKGGPGGGNITTQAAFGRGEDATGQTALNEQFQATAEAAGGIDAYSKASDSGKTILTYKQWVQVRTPNFKKWWGYDWEKSGRLDAGGLSSGQGQGDGNKPGGAGSSPDVAGRRNQNPGDQFANQEGPLAREFTFINDRTGEPRIFMHGTRDQFTVFDENHPNKNDRGWLGRGHYFTTDPEMV